MNQYKTAQQLMQEKMQLLAQINEIDVKLNIELAGVSWKKKAIDCLGVLNKCATTVEILRCVLGTNNFQSLDSKKRAEYVSALSMTMNNLIKIGFVKKVKVNGLKGYYYGLSQWFDEEDKLKQEYADMTLQLVLQSSNMNIGCCD